jgi:hypothetical protein
MRAKSNLLQWTGTSQILGVFDAIEQDNVPLALYRGAVSYAGVYGLWNPPRIGDDGGRWGNDVTRSQLRLYATMLAERGWTVTRGGAGFAGPEEWLPPLAPGQKGNFVDLTAVRNGKTLRIQTIDVQTDGVTPTPREAVNAALIRLKTPGDHVLLVPKLE